MQPDDLKTVVIRKVSNLFLSYPEFLFFVKIIIGVIVLGILVLVFT